MYGWAKCDVTQKLIAINDGVLVADVRTGEWYFCCLEAVESVPNHFSLTGVDMISDQHGFVELLKGLAIKAWFNPDLFFLKIRTL